MSAPGFPRWRGGGPLGVALLAAVLLHALWLAEAQLRQRRQPAPARLQRADDTPELLVFSRQPLDPPGLSSIPLPPASAPPPPPPDLPQQGPSSPPPNRPPDRAPGRAPGRPPGRAGGRGLPGVPAAAAHRASSGRGTRPAGPARPTGTPVGAATGARRPGPPPLPPLPASTPLEALREARRRGPDAAVALEGEGQQRWRSLWQAAETSSSAPAALAGRPEDAELRRLPLARARAEGVDPEAGRPLRLDDHWLLPWIEGDQLWLLRTPL